MPPLVAYISNHQTRNPSVTLPTLLMVALAFTLTFMLATQVCVSIWFRKSKNSTLKHKSLLRFERMTLTNIMCVTLFCVSDFILTRIFQFQSHLVLPFVSGVVINIYLIMQIISNKGAQGFVKRKVLAAVQLYFGPKQNILSVIATEKL